MSGILGLVRPSGPSEGHGVSPSSRAVWLCFCVVAAAAANFLQVCCSVSRVSDVTLESFWVGFSDSFVLQGHGVSPSGRAVWPCFCAVAAAAAAAAAIFL